MIWILWLVFICCLTFACITDLCTHTVINLTWWIAWPTAAVLIGTAGHFSNALLPDLLVFALLQLFLFSRFYGRADSYAFIACSLALTSEGLSLRAYLVQMLLSFIALGVVQGLRGNIARDGNLKVPVAFLPYITLALYGTLWYYNC